MTHLKNVCYKTLRHNVVSGDDGVFPFRNTAAGGSYQMKGKAPFLILDEDVLLPARTMMYGERAFF